jgi:hypothetical protein
MTVDSVLSSWQDAPEAERRSILAALQVFADAESRGRTGRRTSFWSRWS